MTFLLRWAGVDSPKCLTGRERTSGPGPASRPAHSVAAKIRPATGATAHPEGAGHERGEACNGRFGSDAALAAFYSRGVSADEHTPDAVDRDGLSELPSLGGGRRRDSAALIRIMVGVVAVVLLVGSVTNLVPAVRAGLHHGVRGSWVVTGLSCVRKACTWTGKFVLPSGHVQLARAQYDGAVPAGIHAGSRIPALYSGGSALVYPTTGSDQWISLVVAIVVALLGLYWAGHRWVAAYLRSRRAASAGASPAG